jgi:hypothetical protein
MDGSTRRQTVELLREAAHALEADEATEVIMPGWDEAFTSNRERGIQTAAEAIRVRGKNVDEGSRVHVHDLGFLVRYVADMLEP